MCRSEHGGVRHCCGGVIALGALWRGLEAGMFVDHALMSASHHIQMTMPGSVADVFLY